MIFKNVPTKMQNVGVSPQRPAGTAPTEIEPGDLRTSLVIPGEFKKVEESAASLKQSAPSSFSLIFHIKTIQNSMK